MSKDGDIKSINKIEKVTVTHIKEKKAHKITKRIDSCVNI